MYSIRKANKILVRRRCTLRIWKPQNNFGTDVEFKPIRSVLVANRGEF